MEFYGYPIEEYTVQSLDGYILKVYRIPGSSLSPPSPRKRLLWYYLHRYCLSSIYWVKLGPNQSIAFTLADNEYGVWQPNTRGNTLSRKPVTLSPNDSKFWEFTMHEVGLNDLPPLIDFALNITKQKKIALRWMIRILYVIFSASINYWLICVKDTYCTFYIPSSLLYSCYITSI